LNVLGIKPNYYRAGYSDAVQAIQDRRIVGYVKSGSITAPDSTILNLATTTDIRMLDFTEEDIAKIKKVYPYWDFITLNNVDELYPGVEPELTTRAIVLAMGGTKNLPEDLVYKIVKVVCENVEYQAESFPAAKGLNLAENTVKYAQTPLHPGTIKYLREQGYEIPERLIPPELK